MQTKTELLPISKRRSGIKNDGIKYIVAHDTGGPMATAQDEVNYYIKSANDLEASAHYFVDDVGAIMCIPEDEKAWHVHYNAGIAPNLAPTFANDVALGIELCYFPSDPERSLKAYNNYCSLIASLCTKFNLKPLHDIVGHGTLDPTRRTDPLNAFGHINKTWGQFLVDVSTKVGNTMENVTPETPQVLVIKSISVTYDKAINGEVTDPARTVVVTPTQALSDALQTSDLVESGWNIKTSL